jgi:fatty acid desaturase
MMIDGETRAALDGKMRAMEEAHGEYHWARREARRVAVVAAVSAALAALAAAVGRGALVWCVGGLLLALALCIGHALAKRASARRRLAALMGEAAGLCGGR